MADRLIQTETLTAIADAIRKKNGSSDTYTPLQMAPAIDAIQTGGGTASAAERKAFNFYDFDGTLLHSYTAEEAHALTTLPDIPDHTGDKVSLTADGWNRTLEQVQAADAADVGAMYHTTDGKMHVIVHNGNWYGDNIGGNQGITLTVPAGCSHITWGDGTEQDVSAGASVTHKYSEVGKFDVAFTGAKSVGFNNKKYLKAVYLPASVTSI